MSFPRFFPRPALLIALLLASLPAAGAETSDRNVPDWAADAIWYQIFPDRFRNGDSTNDPIRESLEWPIQASNKWRISPWTGDWYARDEWETEQDLPNDKDASLPFYKNGVFDRRYGGDLQGVLDKLDYLSDLGINSIYFNPLFYSRSLHKYDGNTYHHIDPYFGPNPSADLAAMEKETSDPKTWQWTEADKLFLKVLAKAHRRGIRVILDGVFNHTGRDFFAFKDLRKNQDKSPYKSWYMVSAFDNLKTRRNEFDYAGWWGHKTLPEFDDTKGDMAPGPKAYIFDSTRRWMDPDGNGNPSDGIDGWRLDVADELPVKFWHDWNAHVQKLNPSAYTTAEIWKDAAKLIREGGFSASMNYNAFAIPVKGFLIDNNVAPSKFSAMIEERRSSFSKPVAYAMQNLLDSHDTDRFASMIVNGEGTRYGNPGQIDFNTNNTPRSSATYKLRKPDERERAIQRMIVLFQMTYAGGPMIYYGDEGGMWGAHDPDNRQPMVWADKTYDPQTLDPRGTPREPDEVAFDPALFAFYKNAIALRRDHPALRRGDYQALVTDDEARTFAFSRRDAKEQFIVALNRSDTPQTINLTLASAENSDEPAVILASTPGAIEAAKTGNGLALTLPPLTTAVISLGGAK